MIRLDCFPSMIISTMFPMKGSMFSFNKKIIFVATINILFHLLYIRSCNLSESSKITLSPSSELIAINGIPKIAFNRKGKVWLLNSIGELIHSPDKGETWNKVPDFLNNKFEVIDFNDEDIGWAIDAKGQIWKSIDAGSHWNINSSLDTKKYTYLGANKLKFNNESEGYIVAPPFRVWRTKDSGKSWQVYFDASRFNQNSLEVIEATISREHLGVIGCNRGTIARTFDDGSNWEFLQVPSIDDDISTLILDTKNLWLITRPKGIFQVSKDRGKTWNPVFIPNEFHFTSSYFSNEDEGWAIGQKYKSTQEGGGTESIFHTSDGGSKWAQHNLKGINDTLSGVYFTDANNGWVVGRENIFRTNDGGETWKPVLKLKINKPIL